MAIKNSLKADIIIRGARYEITIPWDTDNGSVPAGFTSWKIYVYIGEDHSSDTALFEYSTEDVTVTLGVDGGITFVLTDVQTASISEDLSQLAIGVWRLDDDSEVPLFKGTIPVSDVLLVPPA